MISGDQRAREHPFPDLSRKFQRRWIGIADVNAGRNVSWNDRRRAVTPNYDAIIEETSQLIDIGSSDLCRSADGVTTVAEAMVKVRHWDSATSIHPNRQNLHLEEHAVRGTRNKSSMRSPRAPHTTRAART